MNTPESDSDQRWDDLVRRARADVSPPGNVAAALRAVRDAAGQPRPGWFGDFSALFATARAIPACFALAAVVTLSAAWQAWSLWEAIPWAQMVASTTGGAP